MRYSLVSLLSDDGTPVEDISGLVAHRRTAVTEAVYGKQIRRTTAGAEAMDQIFENR